MREMTKFTANKFRVEREKTILRLVNEITSQNRLRTVDKKIYIDRKNKQV